MKMEVDKMLVVKEESQIIGEFIEWLNRKYVICVERPDRIDNVWMPITKNIEQLLAEYYNIDLQRTEKEKRKILEKHRKENEQV